METLILLSNYKNNKKILNKKFKSKIIKNIYLILNKKRSRFKKILIIINLEYLNL